jgi:GntR family transcriptional regulator
MRLWLSKNSEVPIREQLVTQIILGIASNDLKPGQKLPSTRELARRYRIHANTVSAVYRDLSKRGWVDFRKGSGVYVRPFAEKAQQQIRLDASLELDQLISNFFHITRSKGYSLSEIRVRVEKMLMMQPPDHFLVVEPDVELRQILAAEIHEATGFRTLQADPVDYAPGALTGSAPVALYTHAETVRAAMPAHLEWTLVHTRSIPEAVAGQRKPEADELVGVASRWPDFLRWARAFLAAAGIDPDAMSFRDAREKGWQKGLRTNAFVITDALTARQLPEGCTARVFRIISDASLNELRALVGQMGIHHR